MITRMHAALARLRAGRQAEHGAVSIEFLAGSVVVFAAVLIGLQALLAMHSLSQANSAARNAARAESIVAGSGVAAGNFAVSESLRAGTTTSCANGAEIRCTTTVSVPVLNISWLEERVPPMQVSRTAVFPRTEP